MKSKTNIYDIADGTIQLTLNLKFIQYIHLWRWRFSRGDRRGCDHHAEGGGRS